MSTGSEPMEHLGPPVQAVTIPPHLCRRCVRALSRRLRDLPGVVSFEVDAVAGRLRISGDVTAEAVREAVGDPGCR
jgi:copper chaperone CopZ